MYKFPFNVNRGLESNTYKHYIWYASFNMMENDGQYYLRNDYFTWVTHSQKFGYLMKSILAATTLAIII